MLVLLPDSTNKLLTAWKGPFLILEKKTFHNSLIGDIGKHTLYHANLLKQYHRCAHINQVTL